MPQMFQGRIASCGLWLRACKVEDERDTPQSTHVYTTEREHAPWLYKLKPSKTRGLGKGQNGGERMIEG